MTETTQAAATQAASNGQAPGVPPAPDISDTGEKWLGVLLIASAAFLLLIGIDRVTGGALSGKLFYGGEADAGG